MAIAESADEDEAMTTTAPLRCHLLIGHRQQALGFSAHGAWCEVSGRAWPPAAAAGEQGMVAG